MRILKETFQLNTGAAIPKLGFGTWQLPEGDIAYNAVRTALESGYRAIDAAYVYDNERSVGRAIRESGVKREDIFLVSKLPAEIKTQDGAKDYFHRSLKLLNTDYLDLYLIHAPWPWSDQGGDYNEGNVQAYRAMEDLHKSGLCRSIGVSNFDAGHLQYVMDRCDIVPAANQIRYFVGYTQPDITRFCQGNGMLVMGFSPLATSKLLGNANVCAIAEKYKATAAQLSLRYCVQKGVLPLPRSANPGRIRQNAALDFEISPQDMAALDKLRDTVPAPSGPSSD
jgi:diketogulonate reductase-like aldo/keto reductase